MLALRNVGCFLTLNRVRPKKSIYGLKCVMLNVKLLKGMLQLSPSQLERMNFVLSVLNRLYFSHEYVLTGYINRALYKALKKRPAFFLRPKQVNKIEGVVSNRVCTGILGFESFGLNSVTASNPQRLILPKYCFNTPAPDVSDVF